MHILKKIRENIKTIKKQKIFKRCRKKLIVFAVIIWLYFVFQHFPVHMFWTHERAFCRYSTNNDSLTSIDSYTPTSNSIFFHETSCSGYITPRQSCSIESAARAHRNRQIYIIFSGPVPTEYIYNRSFLILKTYKNVNFAKIRINEYSKNTPISDIPESSISRWHHVSSVLRFLTLFKFGGIYMDLDIIVAKSLESLARNWAKRESDTMVSSSILAFSKDEVGKKVAEAAVRDLTKDNNWKSNGQDVITRVLQNLCSTTQPSLMSSATCNGFEVYGPQFFNPIERESARDYFVPGELSANNAYTYKTWGHISKKFNVMKGSPYHKLAKQYCPLTYKLYTNKRL